MITRVKFTTTAVTHEGRARSVNQDSLLVREEAALWAVADGMGGHQAGEVASAAIVSALQEPALDGDIQSNLDQLKAALKSANDAIFAAASRVGERMGSTAAMLHVNGMQFACVWVGDSRIYRFRDGRLKQITRDHTHVQELIDRGTLTREEASHHPMSHVVSRAVGVDSNLETDGVIGELETRDIFLLCSDGLTGMVSDEEIAAHLQTERRGACQALLELVLDRGAPDNVTIITVVCEEKTAIILDQEI